MSIGIYFFVMMAVSVSRKGRKTVKPQSIGSQMCSVAVAAASETLLEIQILRPHPRPTESETVTLMCAQV